MVDIDYNCYYGSFIKYISKSKTTIGDPGKQYILSNRKIVEKFGSDVKFTVFDCGYKKILIKHYKYLMFNFYWLCHLI